MIVVDLYRIITPGQKVIIRDYISKEVYIGSIDCIPLDYMEKCVQWISTSYEQNNTITIIIK